MNIQQDNPCNQVSRIIVTLCSGVSELLNFTAFLSMIVLSKAKTNLVLGSALTIDSFILVDDKSQIVWTQRDHLATHTYHTPIITTGKDNKCHASILSSWDTRYHYMVVRCTHAQAVRKIIFARVDNHMFVLLFLMLYL